MTFEKWSLVKYYTKEEFDTTKKDLEIYNSVKQNEAEFKIRLFTSYILDSDEEITKKIYERLAISLCRRLSIGNIEPLLL